MLKAPSKSLVIQRRQLTRRNLRERNNIRTTFPVPPLSKQKCPFVQSPKEEISAGKMLEKAVQKETSSSILDELRIRISYCGPVSLGKGQPARETWVIA